MQRSTAALVGSLLVLLGVLPAVALGQTPSPSPSPTAGPTATATPYPPDQPTCLADRSQADPGEEVDVTGDGWQADSTVDLDFRQSAPTVNRDLGSAQANAAGTFVETVRIPADAHGGPASIVLTGTDPNGQDATCRIDLTISGGPGGAACAQVSDDVVTPGQAILVFSADGCWQPGTNVRIFFLSEPVFVGQDEVDDDGSFSTEIEIPEDATLGAHTIRVRGTDVTGAPALRTVPIEVVSGAAGGGLAITGIALWGLLALAVALLAMGSSFLVAARTVPAGVQHTAVRQERHRRMLRAGVALSAGFAALAAWLVAAALHPGDPAGLSLSHPISPGTLLLALLAWWAISAATRPDTD